MPLNPVSVLPGVSGYKGRLEPLQGRVAVQAKIDFTQASGSIADAPAYQFDFARYVQNDAFDLPRTIFVDNSNNPNQILVDVSKTPMDFPIPAYSVAILPTFAEPGSTITLSSIGGATGLTDVMFFSTREQPFVYSGFAPGPSGQTVISLPPTAKTITSRNFALVMNIAHDVFPAVATSSMKRFRNVGDSVAWYNIGADATGNPANGDQQLDPNSEWVTLPYMTTERISFINLTDACQILAEDVAFL